MLWSTQLINVKEKDLKRGRLMKTWGVRLKGASKRMKGNSSCTLLNYILIKPQYVSKSFFSQLFFLLFNSSKLEQAFCFVPHKYIPWRRVEDRHIEMESQIYWDYLVLLSLKHYATAPLLLWCLSLSVWIFSVTSLPMMLLFNLSVFSPLSLPLSLQLLVLWSALILSQFRLPHILIFLFWFRSVFLALSLSVYISLT